ncbi:hypothetical protein K2173_011751 [Erythroxylum novogranatense]|uniref:Uncharacterized protein n=1 Tax=Erythroxylum novogranatense TaxID=1862640 RepID=A0AAV8TJK8_9ROSI|nr:hypothetical protein K2173_011751 [Erythroxylum novogranatense]
MEIALYQKLKDNKFLVVTAAQQILYNNFTEKPTYGFSKSFNVEPFRDQLVHVPGIVVFMLFSFCNI